ncbi:hypothetical protein [Streptomyces cyaneofuscatus]|uniref:hypothetical protein n=1 Tax=Streptomyces cyaneofuscatus TaxID=66883 RepID=UPI0036632259
MRRKFASLCAGLVIAASTAVGCTATVTPDPAATGRPQRTSEAQDAGYTGEDHRLTEAEEVLVRSAQQRLVQQCMEKAGFRYWAGALPTADDLKGGGIFLTDVGWAKRNGYGSRLQKKAQNVQRDDPNSAYANALPQGERVRYSETLLGSPSRGVLKSELPGGGVIEIPRDSCLSDAKSRLYGDFATWFRAEKTATNLTPLYVPDLMKDRRFTRAVDQWSACMRAAGHDYARPQEIREKLPRLTEGLGEEKAYAAEVGLAVAEATCAEATPLAGTARALDAEYRKKRLQRYADDIAAYERMSREALARAGKTTGPTS